MITIGLTLFIFLDLITYLIFFDVILSWLTLIGLNFRPKFLSNIIDPIYDTINKIIPTSIGPIRFDAIIAIFILYGLQTLLIMFIPGLHNEIIRITALVG